jgi:hypothetical protein
LTSSVPDGPIGLSVRPITRLVIPTGLQSMFLSRLALVIIFFFPDPCCHNRLAREYSM